MSPQQLLDRIYSDLSLLTAVFVAEHRHMGAVTLQRAASHLRNAPGVVPLADQVAEMSADEYASQCNCLGKGGRS